ncbi:MAG: MbnP family protein [Bacteroidia bacterium]
MKNGLLIVLFIFSVLSACKDKDVSTPIESVNALDTMTNFVGLVIPKEGSLDISLTHFYASKPLVLNTDIYVNAANDTFNVEELRYYFTNLSLQKADGSWINLKNYQLIDFKTPQTSSFTINKIPAGHYKSLRFYLGVDSLNNTSGLQEGALDPSWGMFWTWNSGYIFYRIMGRNPNTGRTFSFDLGGNENLPLIVADLNSFKLKKQQVKLSLKMDINEMFQNPMVYSFVSDGYAIHTNTASGAHKLAANMNDMVSVSNIE